MATIITVAGKGSKLTPSEVDSNFIGLNTDIKVLQANNNGGSVTSMSAIDDAIDAVIVATITDPTSTPVLTFTVTGSAGYVKSSGSALSSSASIPVSDLTGVLPKSSGGMGISSSGTAYQFVRNGSGSTLEYVTISVGSNKITLTQASGTLVFDVDPANIPISSLAGTLGINKGGSGQTTANAALNAFLPSQASAANKKLASNGSNSSWEYTIDSLNGLTDRVQTISVDSDGSDFAVASASGIHKFSLPDSSLSARGALNSADFQVFSEKLGRSLRVSNAIDLTKDIYYIDSNVNLPPIAAEDIEKIVTIKNIDGSARSLSPDGAERIEGLNAAITIPSMGAVTLQIFDNTNWYVIYSNYKP